MVLTISYLVVLFHEIFPRYFRAKLNETSILGMVVKLILTKPDLPLRSALSIVM